MTESEIRFSYSPSEEAHAADVLGVIADRSVREESAGQQGNRINGINPKDVLKTKRRLDLGVPGALEAAYAIRSKSLVHRSR